MGFATGYRVMRREALDGFGKTLPAFTYRGELIYPDLERERAAYEYVRQRGQHDTLAACSDELVGQTRRRLLLETRIWPTFISKNCEIGIRSAAGPYSLSKEEIIRFAKQYDPIPRHIDEELAAQSVFGGLTASGSHTFAIYILLSGQLQPHFQVLMGLGWDELKLTNPVRPGDALDLEMTVLELRPSKIET